MKEQGSIGSLAVSALVAFGAVAWGCGSYPSSHAMNGTGGSSGTTSTGGSTSTGGTSGGAGGTGATGGLPCDIFQRAGHACVSAHSTVRALVTGYSGPLYQVCKGSAVAGPNSCKGMPQDIGVVDGYADAASQDTFCAGGVCTITIVYDQSGLGNHLEPAPPGGAKPTPGNPVPANAHPITVNGHSVYGMLFRPGQGYRKLFGNGTATGDDPESMYMVSSQSDLINGCCFDYGNAETTANDDGNGTMEAVYLGLGVIWGSGVEGGPWVMADLENGLYPGWENGQFNGISTNTPLKYAFATAVVVGDTQDKNGGKGRFALYGGDATAGVLKTMYDGIRPEKPGYVPMQKQGSVILSVGGDNSDFDGGRFYEGVMVSGAASKETVDALQAAVVAAGYGR